MLILVHSKYFVTVLAFQNALLKPYSGLLSSRRLLVKIYVSYLTKHILI